MNFTEEEKEFFMKEALKEAQKAAENEEVPIGVVIVKDGEIIARDFNRRELDGRATHHAEVCAIEAANQKVYQCAKEDFDLAGMGTTVVGAMVEDDVAYIANIGDSRFYRLHEHLEQITVDHSLVEEMVQSGEIQKEEMRTHPNKNIITRALGTDDTVRPDCFEVKVEPGDVLLLCSDGLTNMVEDSQIEKIVKENKEDMKLAGEKLVQQANEAGGKDNISVILVRL